ncbi:unannotated protein [freshwater metagenome]|uniref:Unannotated protein n=1 Tax=freshwater metagenome TaxID=449393 RepID=A0A6J7BZR5_9ZZZZ
MVKSQDAVEIVDEWTTALLAALATQNEQAVAALFVEDSWWRDLLSVTWDLRTFHGARPIASGLIAASAGSPALRFEAREDERPVIDSSVPGGDMVEAFLRLLSDTWSGTAVLRLRDTGADGWKAWTFLTAMDEIKGHETTTLTRRPLGNDVHESGALPWHIQREDRRAFTSSDPTVLVVGGGQGGLSIAAQLETRGVSTLVIEKNPRIGDNWRNRYESLVLHDPVWADHLPFVEFPESWPIYSPKNKLADWLEGYVSALDLNVWTGTTLGPSSFDAATDTWTVEVTEADGTVRTLRPRHVVLATGAVGGPMIPKIPGMDTFAGQVHHSSTETTVDVAPGTRIVVVGACNSGHDIAQAYCLAGADVTMVQRSATYVMSQKHGIPALFGSVYSEGGPPLWKADLINSSYPYPLLLEFAKPQTVAIAKMDADLIAGLEAAGFNLGIGPAGEDDGLMGRALRRAGGYYIDVGCSQLIIDGKIKIRSGSGVREFTTTGVVLEDGTTLDADVVVLATGFANMRETARDLFGDAVADRCGDVWDLDDEGELKTIWRQSGHPRFWFMGGSLLAARVHSKYLALQILGMETAQVS